MPLAISTCSDWCATDEDLAAWSSPASISTPPCADVPAELACLSTSTDRSTPGPLPYHMPNTPSRSAPGNRFSCCVPQTAVAARSSFTPGWNTTSFAFRCRLAFHRAWSSPPSGDPR